MQVDNYRVFVIVFSQLRHRTFLFSPFRLRVFVFVLSCFCVLRLLNKNAMALTEHRNISLIFFYNLFFYQFYNLLNHLDTKSLGSKVITERKHINVQV